MSNATIVALVALVVVVSWIVDWRWRLKWPQSERYKLSGQDVKKAVG